LPHYLILDNFVESILNNQKLFITPEEGMKAAKIAEEAERLLNNQ